MASSLEREPDQSLNISGNAYSGISASGSARQQNGNITNNYANTYTLRQRRSDETLREDQRSPLLLRAAAEGQTRRIKYLIQLGVNLDYHDDDGLTALHHAVLSGFEDTVQELIDAGSDVNSPSERFGTPLCLAALKARNNVIRLLLNARASLSAAGGLLGSALQCACSADEVSTVELLLAQGARANDRRPVDLSASDNSLGGLLWQDLRGVRKRLLSLEGIYKFAPLQIAVFNNSTRVADLLLRHGAHVDGLETDTSCPSSSVVSKGQESVTPLALAASLGLTEMLTFLLEHGADHSLRLRESGLSALMYAVGSGNKACATILIENGASLNSHTKQGGTALMLAAVSGHTDCVKLLLDAGALPDIKDSQGGYTALHWAVMNAHSGVVSDLLRAGADPSSKDDDERTPLDVLDRYYSDDENGVWIAQERQ